MRAVYKFLETRNLSLRRRPDFVPGKRTAALHLHCNCFQAKSATSSCSASGGCSARLLAVRSCATDAAAEPGAADGRRGAAARVAWICAGGRRISITIEGCLKHYAAVSRYREFLGTARS